MFQKNEEIILTIDDMSVDGDGIGHIDGFTFFVKGAVAGDQVRAGVTKLKKTYGYARLLSVLTPSPHRVVPACPVAKTCGGCTLQAVSYAYQLTLKERRVREDLCRIGGFPSVEVESVLRPVVGMTAADAAAVTGEDSEADAAAVTGEDPAADAAAVTGGDPEAAPGFRYRNKAQYPVGEDAAGNAVTGFYAARSHRIVPVEDCKLGAPAHARIMAVIREYMRECRVPAYDEETGKGLLRHVLIRTGYQSGEIAVCLVTNGVSLPEETRLTEALFRIRGMTSVTLNINTKRTNVILGEEIRTLRGPDKITDAIGDVRFRISPKSFYQVNPAQTKKLYEKVLCYAALTGKETVWDLYCGIGTISLFLARHARAVYGIEVIPEAVHDARENARINGISNVAFLMGRAEEILPAFYAGAAVKDGAETGAVSVKGKAEADDGADASAVSMQGKAKEAAEARHPDVIVVDPPRKGCDQACLKTMLAMQPERIIYVSCDPATLSRDLRILCDGGYRLREVTPFDQFPQTGHVETVCLLCNQNAKPTKWAHVTLTMDEYRKVKEEIEAEKKEKGDA